MSDIELSLKHFSKVDPKLYALLKQLKTEDFDVSERVTNNPKVYQHNLYRSIVSQQLSTKAAATIFARFINLVENTNNNHKILNISDEQYKSIGLSRQKISYIRDITLKIEEGSLNFKKIDHLDDKEIIIELTKVKGVGKWTAEMFLIFSLGRKDVFSPGDLGLLRAVQRLYDNPDITKDELLGISKKWSPYRSIASLTLWHSLNNT